MKGNLFIVLYAALIVSMIVLFAANFEVAWIFFGFLFIAVFGGFFLVNRPSIIALSFLIASLIVLGVGIYYNQYTLGDQITIIVGAGMTALSASTLFWLFLNPNQSSMPDIKDQKYKEMNEQEFLHQVSVDTNVNIELLEDLYQNDEFWALVRAGKIIDAIVLFRSIQPDIGLREAKSVVEAFAARIVG